MHGKKHFRFPFFNQKSISDELFHCEDLFFPNIHETLKGFAHEFENFFNASLTAHRGQHNLDYQQLKSLV